MLLNCEKRESNVCVLHSAPPVCLGWYRLFLACVQKDEMMNLEGCSKK